MTLSVRSEQKIDDLSPLIWRGADRSTGFIYISIDCPQDHARTETETISGVWRRGRTLEIEPPLSNGRKRALVGSRGSRSNGNRSDRNSQVCEK